MNAANNRQWRVARYPERGELIGREHFSWHEESVPEPADGQFLVRTICLAPGPAQRGYLDAEHDVFLDPLPVGAVMRGRGIGRIVASRHADYAEGQYFLGSLGWQDYSLQEPRGADFVYSTKRLESPLRPLSLHLSILGQAGTTAWFGLHEAGQLKAGDTVLVSAAAGGVGSVAVQIARLRGARQVVGISGSDEKTAWLRDTLGIDATINYRTEDVGKRLGELFPDGIDVFFDTVGGDILNTALAHLAMHARIAICGFIATDYAPGSPSGPANYRWLVWQRARMQGFVVFDYWSRWEEAEQQLFAWYRDGQLVNTEDVSQGLETMPDCVGMLFSGGNRGVKLCRIAPDDV